MQKAAFIEALHKWAEAGGWEQGGQVVGEVIRAQTGIFELEELLDVLAERSGLPIQYKMNE